MNREDTAIQLGCAPGHFPEAIIREVLSLPFFDGFENETGDEFRLVTISVTGRRPAIGRIPHSVFAEVCGSDERIAFTDDDAILFQPSSGSKVPPSSEQSIRKQRVNSIQTARRKELCVDSSVNLAEGGGMVVMARASERMTPPNRSVSAK